MLKSERQVLVNENGRPTAVILPLREYRRLLRRIEDLEDVRDLKRAAKTAGPLVAAPELRLRLKKLGLL